MMKIINSTKADIDTIFDLYDAAIAYQKIVFDKHWQGFEPALIEKEISENRQFKVVVDAIVVCIFAITFDDTLIWGDLATEPAVYIHRIVTNPNYRGNNYVRDIIQWATRYGNENGKDFVRMDTWGDNQKLIDYYTKCGFKFLGLSHVILDDALPKHYQGVRLSLFEIAIPKFEAPI